MSFTQSGQGTHTMGTIAGIKGNGDTFDRSILKLGFVEMKMS